MFPKRYFDEEGNFSDQFTEEVSVELDSNEEEYFEDEQEFKGDSQGELEL